MEKENIMSGVRRVSYLIQPKEGVLTYTAARQQKALKMLWLDFWGVLRPVLLTTVPSLSAGLLSVRLVSFPI